MLSVPKAEKKLFADLFQPAVSRRKLRQAYGAILREPLIADRDQPACDLAQMDGFAISWAAWKKGIRTFVIRGLQKAGQPPKRSAKHSHTLEIFTGAALPQGCDCVIRLEDVQIHSPKIFIPKDIKPEKWQFIRRKASEHRKSQILAPSGTLLTPPQIAVAASAGKTSLLVNEPPRIAVIGTGDELVSVTQPLKPFQSRRSNVYAIDAALKKHVFTENRLFHLTDNSLLIRRSLAKILREFDVCIICGGISMGKFDFVPGILTGLGAEFRIQKVSQRPGKPFLFAKTKSGKPVFGLPGNPVSTLVCLYRYVLPYLRVCQGEKRADPTYVVLAHPVSSDQRLTTFHPVKLTAGKPVRAQAIPFQSSGDYAAWARGDGFVEVPPQKVKRSKGQKVKSKNEQIVKFYSW